MPFKSEAQRGYLFSHHPKVAKEFASHMTHEEEMKLPPHVAKLEAGGHVCMSCGGMVNERGYSEGGEVDENASEAREEAELTDEDGDRQELPHEVGDESPQRVETMRMRDFARALGGRR